MHDDAELPSRRRTRNDWDEYYRNLYSELHKGKKKKKEKLVKNDAAIDVEGTMDAIFKEDHSTQSGKGKKKLDQEADDDDDYVNERGLKQKKVLRYPHADEINDKQYQCLAGLRDEVCCSGPVGCESRSHCCIEQELENSQMSMSPKKVETLIKKKTHPRKDFDLIKVLVDSINSLKEEHCPVQENDLTQGLQPLKFRFDDEIQPPPEQSEWEKQMDSLFCDLELGFRESEIDSTKFSVIENDDPISKRSERSAAFLCCCGENEPILDEQIGIICQHCSAVILDIKYVLPDFYTPPSGRRDRMYFDESPSCIMNRIQFQDSAGGNPEFICSIKEATVWDLIADVEKELYPHQREGFEFMWKNIAGDIRIEKLRKPLSNEGRGCIISHAPGTGKTRLTLMFLMSFVKFYPSSRPIIIAPRGMLLTWESEFIKWHVDVPFHNLNKNGLSGYENAVAAKVTGLVAGESTKRDYVRLLKLYAWMKGRGILGVSYQLFKKLAGENEKGQIKQIQKLLLESPGLLVLDEGHTPRNDQSQLWNALMGVRTHRRIILSGTPFQNTLTELHNTLCLVNPKFVNQIGSEYDLTYYNKCGDKGFAARKRWARLSSSVNKNENVMLMKLKRMLDPFTHVHKGNVLGENLPGLWESLVFLHPTELQKALLEIAGKVEIFQRIWFVSLISVHPSLVAKMNVFSSLKHELEEAESNVDAGVKTKFVIQLIWLADALGERVLIFSQYIDPLIFLKKRITSCFSWNEGKEILYMDGQCDEKQRQESISSFNDFTSKAKVLLATERACSEGISLVGASRVVLLDTVWNPSVEKQAISRAYRLGQKKIVYVYRLFTSGTEVRQYAQQAHKERISQLIFSPGGDGETQELHEDKPPVQDKVLESMLNMETFKQSVERIIHQPKESDLMEIFGIMDNHK